MELRNLSEHELAIMKKAHEYKEKGLEIVHKRKSPTCPAASIIGDGVICKIEDKPILFFNDPISLVDYCHGELCGSNCPTMIKARKLEMDQKENARKIRRETEKQQDEDAAMVEEFSFGMNKRDN